MVFMDKFEEHKKGEVTKIVLPSTSWKGYLMGTADHGYIGYNMKHKIRGLEG